MYQYSPCLLPKTRKKNTKKIKGKGLIYQERLHTVIRDIEQNILWTSSGHLWSKFDSVSWSRRSTWKHPSILPIPAHSIHIGGDDADSCAGSISTTFN